MQLKYDAYVRLFRMNLFLFALATLWVWDKALLNELHAPAAPSTVCSKAGAIGVEVGMICGAQNAAWPSPACFKELYTVC